MSSVGVQSSSKDGARRTAYAGTPSFSEKGRNLKGWRPFLFSDDAQRVSAMGFSIAGPRQALVEHLVDAILPDVRRRRYFALQKRERSRVGELQEVGAR